MRGEFLDLSGARIYYYAAGTRGAGDPVVLIHGFPTSSHLWNDVVPLMPAGHRIVVVDLLGYGRSDRPLSRRVDVAAARRTHCRAPRRAAHRARVHRRTRNGRRHRAVARGATHGARLAPLPRRQRRVRSGRRYHAGIARAALPVMDLLPQAALTALLRRDLLRGYSDSVRATRSVDLYLRPFTGADGRDALRGAHPRAGTTRARSASLTLRRLWRLRRSSGGENDRAIPLAVGIRLRDAIPGAPLECGPGRASLHAGRSAAAGRRLAISGLLSGSAPRSRRPPPDFFISSAASTTFPMSRDNARASCVALVASSIAEPIPDDRSLSKSSFKFCNIRPALSS